MAVGRDEEEREDELLEFLEDAEDDVREEGGSDRGIKVEDIISQIQAPSKVEDRRRYFIIADYLECGTDSFFATRNVKVGKLGPRLHKVKAIAVREHRNYKHAKVV